jgi:archaeal type IV pilus assembly protein PilA
MNQIMKIKKNAKALSPVVASIILIAVTVAVSVVVAAWMGGMTTGLMGNAEQGTITNLSLPTSGGSIYATVQNTGSTTISLTAAYVNGAAVGGNFTLASIAKGQTAVIQLTSAVTVGQEVTVKLTTAKANNLVLTEVVPP